MVPNYYVASTDKICSHCEETIETGERYYYAKEKYSTKSGVKRKRYLYHIKCKKEREQDTNINKLYKLISKKPMFTHELEKYFSRNAINTAYRRLVNKGYQIRKFRFVFRSQSSKLKLVDRSVARGSGEFIIFYMEGMEVETILKILKRYPNQRTNWRDLFVPLLGKVPFYIRDVKDTLLKYPEVFKKVFKTPDTKDRKRIIKNLIDKDSEKLREEYRKKYEEMFNDGRSRKETN